MHDFSPHGREAAQPIEQSDFDDVVWGAPAIGREINRNPRQTYHLLEKGLIPGRKIGDKWVSSKKALRAAVLPMNVA